MIIGRDKHHRASRTRRHVAPALIAAGAVALGICVPPMVSVAAAATPTCKIPAGAKSVFVTATCVDPALTRPYTDKDVTRTTTDPVTKVKVSYRYIHGGFKGTLARFSFYFPAKAKYKGRFFESTYPTIATDPATPATIAFGISNGAYVVSTNNGGGVSANPVIGGYRVNAASAKYSRVIAKKVYKSSARPRGYLYGASGGGYQTMGAMENSSGVWDGGVPMVPGTPNSIPSNFTVVDLALRVLWDKFPQIVDAMEPGGSGNPYAGLDAEEQAVLHEVTRLGFPLRAWFQYAELGKGKFTDFDSLMESLDSTYVNDFWTKPGYAGTDPASPSLVADRIQHNATVNSLVGSPTKQLVLSSVPAGDLTGADLVITSGAAAGKSVPLGTVNGNTVGFGAAATAAVTNAIQPGDQVRIDNSGYLAMQYYQRYQVPTRDMYGWNQYRGTNGAPIYPQRDRLWGSLFANSAGGSVQNGKFHGKMIMLASMLDIQAFPWSANWYQKKALAARGAASMKSNYRLWYMDNAPHGEPATTFDQTHEVTYEGEMHQALLDLDAWVKNGTAPPANTSYSVDADDQVRLPAAAATRKGVQPVVTLTANGAASVAVAVGQAVNFAVKAAAPSGTGKIVNVQWDFNGVGTFPVRSAVSPAAATMNRQVAHAYAAPGTYFAVVRVASQRTGNAKASYQLIQNLARVRIVVTEELGVVRSTVRALAMRKIVS